jgi:hypothetical protein
LEILVHVVQEIQALKDSKDSRVILVHRDYKV